MLKVDKMCSTRTSEPIRVGVLTDAPLHQEGIASIFEDRPGGGSAPLDPVNGTLDELLSDTKLVFLVVDLHSISDGLETLEAIHRRRPDMMLIVIGPVGNDELVLESIMAGARAYVDSKASPHIVGQAIEVVISGSIWAPRRLLSKLIDWLLRATDTSLTNAPPRLTDRERHVLDLIQTARSNREIAHELGIEERTVQAHVSRLMHKTGAVNRIDLLMRTSSPSLLQAVGIKHRRQGDRRQTPAFAPQTFTHK
jgi:DNA-binding NarL/FixJ family response regulator